MTKGHALIVSVLAMGSVAVASSFAFADVYPTRPIRMIVGQPPGGPTDAIARVVGEHLAAALGQPVIVDNRPGAGATLSAKVVASASADGYTLLLSPPGPLTVSPVIKRDLGYDPIKSFAHIAFIARSPQVLIVNPAVPAKSIQELVAYAKLNPGKLNLGHPGIGTQVHLAGELFKLRTATNIVTVPYKGTAGGMTDLIAGHIHMFFDPLPLVLPLAQAGNVRPLAILSEVRHPQLPGTPSMAELGYDNLSVSFWAGLAAPASTPTAIVNKLNSVINDRLKSTAMLASLNKLGAEPRPGSAQDFAAFVAAELQKWSAVVRDTGIKIE